MEPFEFEIECRACKEKVPVTVEIVMGEGTVVNAGRGVEFDVTLGPLVYVHACPVTGVVVGGA